MKKIFFALAIILSATACANAQTVVKAELAGANSGHGTGKVQLQDLHITTKLKEGQNSMLIKQGKGTLQFTKSGDKFTNVSFKDSTGVVRRLIPVPAGTQGAPKPDCKYPLPDACFGTADKNIGLCICKPTDLSAGYTISFYYVKKHIGNIKYND